MKLKFNFGLTGRPELKRDEELMVERLTLIAEGARIGYFEDKRQEAERDMKLGSRMTNHRLKL
jgi:hypothetical protein